MLNKGICYFCSFITIRREFLDFFHLLLYRARQLPLVLQTIQPRLVVVVGPGLVVRNLEHKIVAHSGVSWHSDAERHHVLQDACSHALIDALALVQQQQSVQLAEHLEAGLVDGEDDRLALLDGQSLEDLDDVVGHVAVQSRSGLIQDQQVRLRHHLDGDAHSFLLSPRDALDELAAHIGVLALLQSEVSDQFLHSLLRLDPVGNLEPGCELQRFCVYAIVYLSR